MQNDTPVMDRAEVERIAYQAIGHQFRLPSLFAMVLLLVGFVLGHYVAARHTGEIADRFEQRITALQEQLTALELGTPRRSPTVHLSYENPSLQSIVEQPEAAAEVESNPFDNVESPEPPTFHLAGMGRTFETVGTDFTMLSSSMLGTVDTVSATQSAIEGLRQAAKDERDACLAELAPYVERRLSVPAATVVEVLQTVYADQDRRLASAMDNAETLATGIHSRDTSVKIFPPMSEEGPPAEPAVDAPAAEKPPAGHRFFPKPSAPRSLFFSPVSNRVPAPATSAIDTDAVLR